MQNLDNKAKNRLIALAKKNLQLSEKFHVSMWTNALPIYKFISKQPLLRCIMVCLTLFLFVMGLNYKNLSLPFIIKQLSIIIEIFIGFYSTFYFSIVTDSALKHLTAITLLPKDSVIRWFREGCSVSFGRQNLLSNEQVANYSIKNVIQNDKIVLIWFLIWNVAISGVLFIILEIPKIELSAAVLSQYFMIILWSYSWLWTPHWVVYGIGFILKFAKLPVRYFLGIPDALTLKGIGNAVAKLGYGAFIHYLFLLFFLYFWEVIPHDITELFEVNPYTVIVFLIAFAIYIFVSFPLSIIMTQIAVIQAMIQNKDRKLAEYANHIESAFDTYMKHPYGENIDSLKEIQSNMKLLRKLPVFGMTLFYFIVVILMFFGYIVSLYFFLKVLFHDVDTFLNIFNKIL